MLFALCHDCRKKHRIVPDLVRGFAPDAFTDWREKHRGHRIEFRPSQYRRADVRDYGHNADIKIAYQAEQTLTNAIEGLATSSTWLAGYESAWIDNASNLYADYLHSGKVTVGTTPNVNTEIRLYVVTHIDSTPTYPDVFDGTTGAETVTSEGIRDGFAKLASVMRCDSTTSDRAYPYAFSVASLFGGVCPRAHCIFTVHNTGVNLNATGSNQVFKYRGVYFTST